MNSTTCPYLGLRDDKSTSTAFPYAGNLCYRLKSPVAVLLAHQQNYCLKPAHTGCPGYKHGWKHGFPKVLRERKRSWKRIFKSKRFWTAVLVLMILFVWLVFPQHISALNQNILDTFESWVNPTPLPLLTLPPSRTPTSTPTLSPTQTNTVTISLTETSTPTHTSTVTSTYTRTATRILPVIPTSTAVPVEVLPPEPTQPLPTQTSPPTPVPTQPLPTEETPPPLPSPSPSPTQPTPISSPSPTL
jgi:hypothetical protein